MIDYSMFWSVLMICLGVIMFFYGLFTIYRAAKILGWGRKE